jgi:hypothetical protein
MDAQFYYSSLLQVGENVLELHGMIEVGVASSGYYSDGKGSIVE